MSNLVYLFLALTSAGVIVWQSGFLLGISGAPTNPDPMITLSALTAAIIFTWLWRAGKVHRGKSRPKLSLD